ncbi:hypothetical protein LB456_09735 [Psychroflexus sp. CAK57W]|uniref:hypothetical protein n=1 Tax=Psychroflexus curvus TaxID=2873595 RepID=UPI001CC9109F|nr:hypothetical protein [Psychroflexus curvus]MBZ9787737.1 hypothetical protein [Psychroflexus curvus]
MTPKQEERLRKKIAKIRKELAADKKRWGGFHDDSRGVRYLPPELFVKLKDYKGGLRYLRWFDRTFPDDMGHPFFLFDWTLILFKTGNLKEAEKKAFKTFSSNKYIFDKFLGKELMSLDLGENSGWEKEMVIKHFNYSRNHTEFKDFAEWLENLQTSEKFKKLTDELIEIDRKLITEPVGKTRTKLVNRRYKLI